MTRRLTCALQLVEILGFVGRLLSANDMWALGPYIMQSLLLLVAPALFAASIYIVLGRVILLVEGEQFSLIRQKWLTKIFVTGDVISFLAQCGGGGIQAAGSLSLLHTGEKIIVVGLFLQLAFFGFFVVVAGLFHWRLVHADATSPARSQEVNPRRLPWKQHVSSPPHHPFLFGRLIQSPETTDVRAIRSLGVDHDPKYIPRH